jgi:hypothetical protein
MYLSNGWSIKIEGQYGQMPIAISQLHMGVPRAGLSGLQVQLVWTETAGWELEFNYRISSVRVISWAIMP